MNTALTIAGSDSSGGAGIQADLKTFTALGLHAASAITAVTAQSPSTVHAWEAVSPPLLRAQLSAVFDEMNVVAVKTGMLARAELVDIVIEELHKRATLPVVCDPVFVSTSGHSLLEHEPGKHPGAALRGILELADLVTPNCGEAEALAGFEIHTCNDALRAGQRILDTGVGAVLVTGGHREDAPGVDLLVTSKGSREFRGQWIEGAGEVHGTGCVLSAAIAANLGLGRSLEEAIGSAKEFANRAIQESVDAARRTDVKAPRGAGDLPGRSLK